METSRRQFIKGISLGAAGMTAGAHLLRSRAFGLQLNTPPSPVALMTGSERRQLAYNTVKIFEDHIKQSIQGRQVILKPNIVWHDPSDCATHPDTLRGLLDFFKEITDGVILIAEASASPKGTWYNFAQYGYLPLQQEYNARLVDLNLGEWAERGGIQSLYEGDLNIKIVKPFLDPVNWIFSVARMKSHWHMVATLSVKNVLMASPWNGKRHDYKNQYEKVKMHGNRWNERNNEFLTKNLPTMAGYVFPDFAFIDGFQGMEGNGPEQGTPVDHRIAIAGPDAVAVDRMGAELMGIHPHYLQYVKNCAVPGKGNFDCANINVIGMKPEDHIRKYQWADEIEDQIGWLGTPPPSVCTFNQYSLTAAREQPPPRRLHVDLPHSANTHMAIYNLKGRKVRQLLAHTLPAGRRPISWDELDDNGRRVPPGHYILQLRTGAGMVTQKLTVSPVR